MSAPANLDKQAHDATIAEAKEFDQPIADVETPDPRRFKRTGFSHMPLKWDGSPATPGDSRKGDALMMARIHGAVRRAIGDTFPDALEVLDELYLLVREPVLEDGEVKLDTEGRPVWQTTATGNPREDWNRLGYKEVSHYLHLTTVRIFDWEQRANEAWAEAMFSKALWEDAYSIGYQQLTGAKATIEDRTAQARLESREQRYFALFKTYFSRQAESLVRTFTLINQRLKDVHAPNGNGR
jgi:hypothetical protein